MKKILGLLVALLFANSVYASIGISPTKIEINANKIRNNYAVSTIEVRGVSDQPTRYRIYADYFTITNTSEMNLGAPKTDAHNISKNIRFVPSEFTVPPGKSQKVRVNIANVKALPDGESRAVLFIEDINTKEMNIPNNYGFSTQLVLKTRVGVPVYVDKGNFKKIAEIDYAKVTKEKDGYYNEIKILSKGNSKVRYEGKIQIIKGKKLIDECLLEAHVVGDNNTYVAKQKIETDKIKEAGDYVVRTVLSYLDENGNKKIVKKESTLVYTGEKI